MPISSAEIAALNNGFQSMAMQNLSYSSMIGQGVYGGAPAGSGAGADHLVAGGMNRMHGIGMPLAAGAMGLMGLDPLSIGLRAGMGAFGAGAGFGGAAMAGAGAALPFMAAGAAVQHVGNQMYTGMQDQLGLNNSLRQSFAFRNAGGGMGFNRGEMSSIGQLVRSMTHDMGPGGELASFRELSTLAGKMGQMGFAQGVKDVQDFSKKFKEMVSALKTMAKDLGTTLEGALEFAAAAKGSGVFGMQNIQKFTSTARQMTVSGGLALSEVTGAASIGSQISRSVGGLGSQGAMAGMRTIGQIGTAQQMGILSEQDIYNATGLTGAEGRQALASSSLQHSARWLQGGRGRRLLASLAEKDGTLNEGNVMQLLSGGMSISETMRLDQQQLAKVGRANFIRNEGRLRGAAMERLGGFLPAMQLQEWAQSKGIDINDMDDRSMLFAQRQLGMGRDQMDAAMKMVNNMPQILEQMRTSGMDDKYFQSVRSSRGQRGITGAKKRLEQSKEIVNGKLQELGQHIFNQASEDVDAALQHLFDGYVEVASKDVDEAYRAMRGGASGSRAFGVGGTGMGGAVRPGGPIGGGGMGALAQMSRGMNMTGAEAVIGKGRGNTGFDPLGLKYMSNLAGYISKGQSDMSKLQDAGFGGIFAGAKSDADVAAGFRTINDMRAAAAGSYDQRQVGIGAQGGGWLQEAYAMGRVTGKGADRVAEVAKLISERGTADQKALIASAGGDRVRLAQVVANIERGQGIAGKGGLAANMGMPELGGIERGSFHTEADANRAFANALGFNKQTGAGERVLGGAIGGAIRGAANIIPGLGTIGAFAAGGAIDRFSEGLAGRITGSAEKQQAIGRFARSDDFRDLSLSLLSGNAQTAANAANDLQRQLANNPDDPNVDVKRQMLLASRYYQEVQAHGQEAADKKFGKDADRARSMMHGMGTVVTDMQRRNVSRAAVRARQEAATEQDRLVAMGVYDAATGTLTTEKFQELKAIDPMADRYARLALGQMRKEQGLVGDGGDSDFAAFGRIESMGKEKSEILSNMSVAARRRMAAALGDSDAMRSAAAQDRFSKLSATRGRGAKGALNTMLGAGLSNEELSRLNLDSSEGARAILAKAGVAGEKVTDEMVTHIRAAARGGLAAGEHVRQIMESGPWVEAQKKKQLDKQESEDPLNAAIKRNGEKANLLLEKILKSSDKGNAELQALKESNPEMFGDKK